MIELRAEEEEQQQVVMPSGPKRRLLAKRKKQGSLAPNANSDRETEPMPTAGSIDEDDLESGLETQGQVSARPLSLDGDTLTSQTDDWVRVSDFDVETPASEIEPLADHEDGDTNSSRRSLDKLAESWETVFGEHTPEEQDGSVYSLEEEPSEVKAASVHSSESYTHLSCPHSAGGDKDVHSSDSDRRNIGQDKTASSNFSSSSSEGKSPPGSAAAEIGEEVCSAPHVSAVPSAGKGDFEEIGTLNEDVVEKEVVHEGAPESTVNLLSDETETAADEETPQSDDAVQGSHGQDEGKTPLSSAQALTLTNPDEEKETSSSSKERHLLISTTSGEKNAIEKPRFQAESFSGCCGVLYWLLGWDY